MDEYCPLCRKMGNNKKITAIQINYDEAVWLCEEEKCPWPFGYEEFKFMPRNYQVLSKKSSIKIESRKRKVSTSISTELGLYTPPVTPSNEASTKDASTSNNYNYNDKISPKYSSTLISNSKKIDNSLISNDQKTGELISSIFDIDSSITLEKNEKFINCDNKLVKFDNERKSNAIIMKNTPQIRCIEALPNSFIKIEVIDQMKNSTNSDNSMEKNKINNKFKKQSSIVIDNENLIDVIPKKISINEINNKSFTLNGDFNKFDNCENELIKNDDNLQTNNYSHIFEINNDNNSIENSGQINFGLNGIIDDMLMENCHNVSQVIDDDWITSMLL